MSWSKLLHRTKILCIYKKKKKWLTRLFQNKEEGEIRCVCVYLQARDTGFINLNDGRKLCLECLDSAIMDTSECQPLYLDIQEFYEGLNMKVEQQVPLLLVEREALNEAREGERNVRALSSNQFLV